MKANGAPEKIYCGNNGHGNLSYSNQPFLNAVEYTSTDAFIEKAVEFINKANLYLYHCISEECDYVDTDKFIKDFKNYMKGE